MNLGQLLGEQKLRIWRLEDEVESLRAAQAQVAQHYPVPQATRLAKQDGLPKKVVELLAASERPLPSSEIAARLDCDLHYLYQKLPELLRCDLIARLGRRKHYLYFVPKPVEAAA